MEIIPKIKGKNICLSVMCKDEMGKYFEIFQKLEVEINLWKLSCLRYKDEQEKFYEKVISGNTEQYFTISDFKAKKILGTVGLYDINFRNERASIIIVLDSCMYRKGIAREAVGLILDYGFTFLSLNKVSAYIYEYNSASLDLFKKSGFKKSGREKDQIKIRGEFFDRIIMELRRSEFYKFYQTQFNL